LPPPKKPAKQPQPQPQQQPAGSLLQAKR
jgi:hypothetical protein